MFLWVGKCCNETFVRDVLGYPDYASIPVNMVSVCVYAASIETHISKIFSCCFCKYLMQLFTIQSFLTPLPFEQEMI